MFWSGSDIIFSPSLLQLTSYYTFQVRNFTGLTSTISEGKFCNESTSCLATISISTRKPGSLYLICYLPRCTDFLVSLGPRWMRNIVYVQGTDTNFLLLYMWNIFSGVARRFSVSRQNQTEWVSAKIMKTAVLLLVFTFLRTSYWYFHCLVSSLFVWWTRWERRKSDI
jgi:hypothetical protein